MRRQNRAEPSFAQSMVRYIEGVLIQPRQTEIIKQYSKVFADFEKSLGYGDYLSNYCGFSHNGKLYPTNEYTRKEAKWVKPPESLVDAFDMVLLQQKVLNQDWQDMGRCIGSIMSLCKSAQDIRNALPDTLINKLESQSITEARTIPIEEFPIASKFLKKAYLEEILPKIDYYLAIQLLM